MGAKVEKTVVEHGTRRLPPWIRVKVNAGGNRDHVSKTVESKGLHTVCQSAKCPNLAECWHRRTATIMILGDRCTRSCAFCAIKSFRPLPVEEDEPQRVADACKDMDLEFVVLTSVDRDDLPDKGAGHWAATIRAVREKLPEAGIEVLTPDFKGRPQHVDTVLEAQPTVFNHNMETCARLTRAIRSGNRYDRSLEVLSMAAERGKGDVAIKSGIMLGLGETDREVEETIRDMRSAGVQILTVGQYLPPSRKHWPLQRYVTPEQFAEWDTFARELGFEAVASSPLVRSSYKADVMAREVLGTAYPGPVQATL